MRFRALCPPAPTGPKRPFAYHFDFLDWAVVRPGCRSVGPAFSILSAAPPTIWLRTVLLSGFCT